MRKPSLLSLCVLFLLFVPLTATTEAIYYFENFEGTVGNEWSNTSTDTTPGTAQHPVDDFLGQFGNDTVSLTLNNLSAHTEITVSFDLYIIRTWDGTPAMTMGNEILDVDVSDGQTLLHTGFSNMELHGNPWQCYPDGYPDGNNPSRTDAAENNTLGFMSPYGHIMDSVYSFYNTNSFTFAHSSSSIQLNFSGSNLQSLPDESWGIDNILVTPEPATVLLLGLGGLSIVRKRR